MDMRIWKVHIEADEAGRLNITGIGPSALEAQTAACKVAKAHWEAKSPDVIGIEAGDYIEFGLPK